jgi:hypothetical protein
MYDVWYNRVGSQGEGSEKGDQTHKRVNGVQGWGLTGYMGQKKSELKNE